MRADPLVGKDVDKLGRCSAIAGSVALGVVVATRGGMSVAAECTLVCVEKEAEEANNRGSGRVADSNWRRFG